MEDQLTLPLQTFRSRVCPALYSIQLTNLLCRVYQVFGQVELGFNGLNFRLKPILGNDRAAQ